MHRGILIAIVAATGIAALAVSIDTPSEAVAPVRPPAAPTGDRIVLSPAQAAEARSTGMWPAGTRSVLRTDRPLRHGEWRWNDRGVPPGDATVRIDLTRQLISVTRAGHEIGTAVILYGAESHETPLGNFPIRAKNARYRSRTYDAPMPYALRLTDDGVALHGSEVGIGRATHGCIGLPLAFAHRLFDQARIGDAVTIFRSRPAKT